MGEFFKREVFRPFATLMVPGVIALLPYAIQLLYTYPGVQTFAQANAGASLVIGIIFALAAGLIIEDAGAKIEVAWDNKLDKKKADVRKAGEHTDVWRRYLALTFKDDQSVKAISAPYSFDSSLNSEWLWQFRLAGPGSCGFI